MDRVPVSLLLFLNKKSSSALGFLFTELCLARKCSKFTVMIRKYFKRRCSGTFIDIIKRKVLLLIYFRVVIDKIFKYYINNTYNMCVTYISIALYWIS